MSRLKAPEIKDLTAMLLTSVVRFIQRWKRYSQSVNELSRLSDRELTDIGISRSDIPSVSWEAAEAA